MNHQEPQTGEEPSLRAYGDRSVFGHDGEMGRLSSRIDWAATALGPVSGWSVALRTMVGVLLRNRFPLILWWGPELVQLYNDAYAPIPGAKHPRALGQPAAECWAGIWDVIGPMIEAPYQGEPATWSDDLCLMIDRKGFVEETHFKVAYSPVPDESVKPVGIGGVLGTIAEITEEVYARRQLATLRDLARQAADAKTAEMACDVAARTMERNARDIPCGLFYLLDANGKTARLVGAGGFGASVSGEYPPQSLRVDEDTTKGWPVGRVVRERRAAVLSDLGDLRLPRGAWEQSPNQVVILPLASPEHPQAFGFIVAGVSPHRELDEQYMTFFELAADHVTVAIRNALALQEERDRAEKLAELDRAKTVFFSNISHEFRTPLSLMLGPTEEALASPDGLRGAELEMVHRNELRLLKLVDALLDFSRMEAGRSRASYEPTDLAALTTDLASAFRSAVTQGGLAFDVDCPPLAAPVSIDRSMWENIVLNLLSNAFKFTFDGAITVTLEARGDRVELSVRDTGVGIPEHELPHVFERFHRVDGVRARTHEGSGIGLALVRDIVRLLGGEIEVTSHVGRGTTFTVSLPTDVPHPPSEGPSSEVSLARRKEAFVAEALQWLPGSAPPAPPALERRAPHSEARILVADDNADMRSYLTKVLGRRWTVVSVSDGAEALEAARRDPPDLVLADVMMPVMDGFGLVREMRADARTAAVPIVLLSARAGEEALAEGLRTGADDYLVKPFSASALLVRIEAQLALARVRAAAALERQRLYSLFMDGPAAICLLRGDDLVIELINERALDVWGKTAAVFGKPLLEAIPGLRGQGFDALLREVMRSGVPYRANAALVRHDRNGDGVLQDLYFDFVYSPMHEPEGSGDGVLVFACDVTEQVTARRAADVARGEAELAKAEAEAANRAKDEFLAMLGHELRNPLAPILTALELMRDGDAKTDALARDVIHRQVGHVVRLVDDLLDASRIARGEIELKKQVVEAAVVVAKAIEIASPLLEQFEQELTVDVARAGLPIDGDVGRLAQVVSNLLTNAAKYSERGSAIAIRAARNDDHIVLRVIDEGVGIAPDMLPNVFEMFVQERQSLARSRGGLGLGLAIVRNLVASHDGTVGVESPGRGLGSTFTVSLPAARAGAPGVEERQSPVPVVPSEGLRILVVDDNEDAATMLALFLGRAGHSVRVVHDGPSALEAVAELVPDVALLDIGLPVMDGYELARRLRETHGRDRLRLVAVTGYGQEQDRDRSREAGFDLHLVKPVSRARIAEALAQFSAERAALGKALAPEA